MCMHEINVDWNGSLSPRILQQKNLYLGMYNILSKYLWYWSSSVPFSWNVATLETKLNFTFSQSLVGLLLVLLAEEEIWQKQHRDKETDLWCKIVWQSLEVHFLSIFRAQNSRSSHAVIYVYLMLHVWRICAITCKHRVLIQNCTAEKRNSPLTSLCWNIFRVHIYCQYQILEFPRMRTQVRSYFRSKIIDPVLYKDQWLIYTIFYPRKPCERWLVQMKIYPI